MEGIINNLDERKEVFRDMPSKRVKPGNGGSWGYPRAAFPDSPACVDRKSESSTNSMEAVEKNYGEQWGHAGEVSPPQNSNCSDKMSVGFRLGEMSPELDISSDGGRSSEAGRISPRNNLRKSLNSMPGEPFLEVEISNAHSENFVTPIKQEPHFSSQNFSPKEGQIINYLERAKWKPKTNLLVFNRNERANWNSPRRVIPEGTSKTSYKRYFQPKEGISSSVHGFWEQPSSDWKDFTKNSRVASKFNVMSKTNVKVHFLSQSPCSKSCHRNINECQDNGGKCARVDSSKKVEELLSSWEVFIHKLKNCWQTPMDVVEAIEAHLQLTKDKVGEYCSDKKSFLWPKSVKDPTYEVSYEVLEQEDRLESVIPFQAPSTENRELPSPAVPSGESSDMKFNDSEEVNFTNAANIYDNESNKTTLVMKNSFPTDAISCSGDSVSNLGEPTTFPNIERNNSSVQLAKEERCQNVKDVNEDERFSKEVDPRKDLVLRSWKNRESTIEETNKSLTPVSGSQVKNLSPEESREHEQINAGSNYSLMKDSSYYGKHVFYQRAIESEVQDYCSQDVRNSQAGISSCKQSQMFVNPNRNEYCTAQIKVEALPKQLKSKNREYNATPKSDYTVCQERPVGEALEEAECNLSTKDESTISDTLNFNQNPPPFNPDFVSSRHAQEMGHYKQAFGYKYQPVYEHPCFYQVPDSRYYQPFSYPSQERGPYGMYNVYENRGCRRLSHPYPKPYQQPFPHLNNTSIRTYYQ